ncbi:MAG: sigma-70 family RNA polymerase sigma factor [Planctomycetota bacterium]|nr:sigma-70 family RNA polymerase sigma factor [Planctomycetota bacterium]
MAGDRHADREQWLRSLLERYEGPLVGYAARLIGDADRARDVVQDTFIRLCAQPRSSLDGHVAQWLFTVCRRRALDVRRKESRVQSLTEAAAESCESPHAGPDRLAEDRHMSNDVQAMLATLPENQQEVIRLKFRGGLSYREISAVTGLSLSNVGFLIHTAIKTVRRRLRPSESAAGRSKR